MLGRKKVSIMVFDGLYSKCLLIWALLHGLASFLLLVLAISPYDRLEYGGARPSSETSQIKITSTVYFEVENAKTTGRPEKREVKQDSHCSR